MSRQKQVSVVLMLAAMDSVVESTPKVSAADITAKLAAKLGLSVEDCEARYKRFAGQERYKSTFAAFESANPIEFATVGKQGRPGVDDAILAKYADKFRKAGQ